MTRETHDYLGHLDTHMLDFEEFIWWAVNKLKRSKAMIMHVRTVQ